MHKHHIVPKHAGGTDDPSNIVELTIEDHAEAHRLLFEQHGRWQDYVAWMGLSNKIGLEEIISLKIRLANLGKIMSPETRQKISQNHGMKNKTASSKTAAGMIGNRNSVGHPNGKSNKGQIWINNGTLTRRIKKDEEIPSGFRIGRGKNSWG